MSAGEICYLRCVGSLNSYIVSEQISKNYKKYIAQPIPLSQILAYVCTYRYYEKKNKPVETALSMQLKPNRKIFTSHYTTCAPYDAENVLRWSNNHHHHQQHWPLRSVSAANNGAYIQTQTCMNSNFPNYISIHHIIIFMKTNFQIFVRSYTFLHQIGILLSNVNNEVEK